MTFHVDGVEDGAQGGQQAVPPRIGLVGAWFDPMDPVVWSGTFANIIANLTRLGMYGGYRDATPFGAGALYRLRKTLGRFDDGWTLGADMLALASLTNTVSRRRRVPGVDAWIVPVGGVGRPVATPYVTLSELAPAQYVALGPVGASAFGFPGLTARRLANLTALQVRVHSRATACCVVSSFAADSLMRDHGIDPSRIHVVGCGRNVELTSPPQRDWSVSALSVRGQ